MRKFRRSRQVGGVKPTEMYFKAMNWIHQRICRSNHWRKRLANELLPWALDGLELGRNVLEVGPGPGLTTDILRRRLERLTCLEIDPVLAQSLRERMRGSNVTVVQGDATAMPFSDETYSGAVSFTMLHHVPSSTLQDRLLSEVHRVLEPGAIFAGTDSPGGLLMRLIHIGDTLVPVDPDTFGRRLESSGFSEIVIRTERHAFAFSACRK